MVGDILQPTHLLFILVIALLVLGPKRLPEVGRAVGNTLRDFRQAVSGESFEHHEETVTPVSVEAPQPATTVTAEPVSIGAQPPEPVSVGTETAQPVGDSAQHTS